MTSKPTISLRVVSRLPFEAPLGVRLWAAAQLPGDDVSRWVLELSAEGVDEVEARSKLRGLAMAIDAALDGIE